MNEPSNKNNVVSLVTGVLLGALVPFSIQLYQDSVEQARKTRAERAERIERLMTASTNMAGEETRGLLAYFSMLAVARSDVPPDLKSLVPDMNSIAEMRTLSALYLPEVEPEVKQVMNEYNELLKSISGTVASDVQKIHAGAPPDGIINATKSGILRFKGIDALQAKLIELAKQNRA